MIAKCKVILWALTFWLSCLLVFLLLSIRFVSHSNSVVYDIIIGELKNSRICASTRKKSQRQNQYFSFSLETLINVDRFYIYTYIYVISIDLTAKCYLPNKVYYSKLTFSVNQISSLYLMCHIPSHFKRLCRVTQLYSLVQNHMHSFAMRDWCCCLRKHHKRFAVDFYCHHIFLQLFIDLFTLLTLDIVASEPMHLIAKFTFQK